LEQQASGPGDGGRKAASFERQLGRLVDGELPPSEYRQLVKSLEKHPDGWRRCALAFLESQAWRHDIAAVATPDVVANKPAQASPLVPRPAPGWGSVASRWSMMAASWLVALAIGAWWFRPAPVVQSPPQLHVANMVAPGAPEAEIPPSRVPPEPRTLVDNSTSPSGERLTSRAVEGEVEFVMAGNHGDWQPSTRLPLRSLNQEPAGREVEDFWAAPAIVELLRRSGRQVKHDQVMVPLELPDGRQILVPVEKMVVQPVRVPAY